jgi:hypothetical protein
MKFRKGEITENPHPQAVYIFISEYYSNYYEIVWISPQGDYNIQRSYNPPIERFSLTDIFCEEK